MARWPLPPAGLLLVLGTLAAAGCSGPVAGPAAGARTPAAAPGDPALPLAPSATLQELMRYEVDASADPLWDAVGTVTTREGILERQPHAVAEWETLRRHAVVLVEATNLLVIPGRRVTDRPFPSDGPGVLSSDEIQQRLDEHRGAFNAHALSLRAVATRMVAAIDAHDAAALQRLGEAMDEACEACHLENWYPHEVIPDLPGAPPQPQ